MSVPKIVEITCAIYRELFKIQLCKGYVGRIVNNASELKFRRSTSDIQLFRQRLSYKSVKANATMSKGIIGNGGFTAA